MTNFQRVDRGVLKNNVVAVLNSVFILVLFMCVGGCIPVVARALLKDAGTDDGLTAEGDYRQAVCAVNETSQPISYEFKWGRNPWTKHNVLGGRGYINYVLDKKRFNAVARIRFNTNPGGKADWKIWTVTPMKMKAGGERQYYFTKRNGKLAFFKY